MRATFFRNLFFLFLLSLGQMLFAQLSKVHYLPPIAAHSASNSNAFPRDQYIYISTPSPQDVNYTIVPIGSFPADHISGVVSNSAPDVQAIGSGETSFAITNSVAYAGRVIDDKGYIITADAPIYVAIRLRASTRTSSTYPQAGALVSKGLSALGTSFRTGTFTSANPGVNNNSSNYLNFISLMATQDATQVTFDNLDNALDLVSIPTAGGAGTFSFTIALDAGESYLIAAEAEDAVANRDGLIGVSIESDRPIVVNSGSANGSFHNGGGRDYGIDQMVGADRIGNEYVFVRGNGSDGWENILLVANEDDTDIFLDGNPTAIANLAEAGDYYLIEGDAFSNANSFRTLYLRTSKNVFAWQGTGTNSEANQGMFFVPPLSCRSQGQVNNIPQIDYIGTAFFSGFVNVVTNQTASVTFSDAYNVNKSIEDTSFSGGVLVIGPETVQGADYKAYILQNLSGNVSIESTEELYCSYYNQNGAASSGGFYSGFIPEPETVIRSPNLTGESCLPNVELVASGVESYDSFTWFYSDGTAFVDLGVSNNPYIPINPGAYKIRAQISCDGVTSIAESQPVVVSNCPSDFDGDGINDNIDLDLDNDGIFNTEESLGDYQLDISDLSNPLVIQSNSVSITGAYTVSSVVASDSSIFQTAIGAITSSLGAGGKENWMEWTFVDAVNFKLTQATSSSAHTYLEGEYMVISTNDPTKSLSLLDPDNNLLVDTNYDNTYESGQTLFSANEIRFKYNPSNTSSPTFSFLGENLHNIQLTHHNNHPTITSQFQWTLTLHQNDLDTDGDGLPDAYDLDSDSDGCSDVVEAGYTDSDPLPDGLLGSSPVAVNPLGQVAFTDGYTQPRDGDASGIYDFQEVGSPAFPTDITTQPSPQRLCLGGSANFEVQTSLFNPQFQWQIFDGTQWVDLNDNATYINTNASNMTVSPADNSLDNSTFRVVVFKGNYLCDPIVSNSAILNMAPPKIFDLTPTTISLSETDSPTAFTISLLEAPASNVVLDISNPDITEAVVSPTQVTFTPDNWNVPQSIEISPQSDDVLDGDQLLFPNVSVNSALTQNCYTHAEAKTVSLTITDANVPGFEIVVIDNLTNENGDEASFTVQLLAQPIGVVTLDLSSSDLTEGQLSQNKVQFSPANWNIPQTIVVTGLPDPIPYKDGNIAYQIITGNVSSTDPNYNALDGTTVADINLTNLDNTAPAIELNVVGGSAVTDENGSSFVVEFHLLSQPSGGADVTFGLTILGDPDEVTLSSNSMTILNANWNKPFNNQVTLTGLDDALIDGDIFLVLETADPSSSDLVYDALDEFDVADLIFRNLDNDQAGFSVSNISNNLSEDENIGTFTVVLDIAPNFDVSLDIISNDVGEVGVDPAFQSIQFTPLNWNIPQTILVRGVDDPLIDGDQFTQITVSVAQGSDPNFLSEADQSVNVINMDNDIAQILLTLIDPLTGEDGATGSFSVRLDSAPAAAVEISFESSNPLEGSLVSNTIIFSPTNWNQPQRVTVNGIDDPIPIDDGAITYDIFVNNISSADPNYGNIIPGSIPALSMTNQDNDFSSILIHLIEDDNQTDEDGDQAIIGFSLSSIPLNDGDVTLPLSLQDNIDEISLSKTEITIENKNWDDPWTNVVTLTGLDDALLDGSQNVRLITGDPQSLLDPNYDLLTATAVADLVLVNLDNDFPGLVLSGEISPSAPADSGAVTASYELINPLNESGSKVTVALQLNSQPSSDVLINVFLLDPTEVGSDVSFLIFSPQNWNQPQSIQLFGVDDFDLDGDIATRIIFSVDPATADQDYSSSGLITLHLINQDNDVDPDGDDLLARFDNCPDDFNPDQEDLDGDGIGDACDSDIDGDGVTNMQENQDQTDPYDNCDFMNSSITLVINAARDCDRDGVIDEVDLDDDNDGILDSVETQEDFDQNGIINSYDLDSDGDGCPDVVEAGLEDPDGDGLLGNSPVEVDAQGRVISAQGYRPVADADASGLKDFLEWPPIPSIVQQPPPLVIVFPGQDIRLNVEIEPNHQHLNIQWQILRTPTGNWEDLNESDNFRGVTTQNLTLVNPQESWVPWQFRAAIGSTAYFCAPLIFSQITHLDYQPLRIPNAFSPDNDGKNDFWTIEGLGKFPNHQLTIYSRWESVILNEAPYQNDWGGELRTSYGNANSESVAEGTYFYILDLGNGQPLLKGFIYLKR